ALSSWAGSAFSGAGNAVGAVKNMVWFSEKREQAAYSSTGVFAGTRSALSGVFKQVNTTGASNIYKHVSGSTFGWKQLNQAGKEAIYRESALGWAVNGLGKACLVGAAGLDAWTVGSAAKKDYDAGTYRDTAHATASVAGKWIGASAGAAAGSAALSVVPGVGTLVGGAVGGACGAACGAWTGKTAVDAMLPLKSKL
ncbi:hypothetical protein PFISCL1PPCAC_605, partial [Pristionchus fissidentatus]